MDIANEYNELFDFVEKKMLAAENSTAYMYALWYLAHRLRYTSAIVADPKLITEAWNMIQNKAIQASQINEALNKLDKESLKS